MDVSIRQERETDIPTVNQLIQKAFADVPESDHTEHLLVPDLRKCESFVPELSIVATVENVPIGHILLTKVNIGEGENDIEALALAPVSVLPEWQGKGIGSRLILEAHHIAQTLGFGVIVLIGHAEYYPRFGYEPAHRYDIQFPFEVPAQNAMTIGLNSDALTKVSGIVTYAKPFYNQY